MDSHEVPLCDVTTYDAVHIVSQLFCISLQINISVFIDIEIRCKILSYQINKNLWPKKSAAFSLMCWSGSVLLRNRSSVTLHDRWEERHLWSTGVILVPAGDQVSISDTLGALEHRGSLSQQSSSGSPSTVWRMGGWSCRGLTGEQKAGDYSHCSKGLCVWCVAFICLTQQWKHRLDWMNKKKSLPHL